MIIYDPGLKPSCCNRKWNDQGAPSSWRGCWWSLGGKYPKFIKCRQPVMLTWPWIIQYISASTCFQSSGSAACCSSHSDVFTQSLLTNPLGICLLRFSTKFSKGWWKYVGTRDTQLGFVCPQLERRMACVFGVHCEDLSWDLWEAVWICMKIWSPQLASNVEMTNIRVHKIQVVYCGYFFDSYRLLSVVSCGSTHLSLLKRRLWGEEWQQLGHLDA